MSPSTNVQPEVGVGAANEYVVVDGAVGESALGRRFRYGRPWLEPYFAPTGVPAASQVEAPLITPIWPCRESVLTVAVIAGRFAT